MLATPIQTSWNGGELSPMMAGRTDTKIYAIAAEVLENFVPSIEGPLVKCPGFRRVRAAAGAEWLLRFVFSSTQSYVIEAHPGKLRYYTNGGRIETAGDPYETEVPYASGEWPRVSTQQNYDALYMAHPAHPPAKLKRISATGFDYAALETVNGPFKNGNSDPALTIVVAGSTIVGGTVTLTQTGGAAPIFKPGHAGALFQIEALDFSDIPAWEVGIDGNVGGTTKRRSDGQVYLAVTSGRTGTVQPVHEEGAEWDGTGAGKDINDKGPYGVKWEHLYDRFGIVRLTDIAPDGLSATATVERRLPDSLTSVASWRWAHGCFSDAEGWPSIVFIWNERLCFWNGFDLIGSVAGDYAEGRANFQQFMSAGYRAEDLAFRRTLSAEDAPHWTVVDRTLIVGTPSKEYAIGAQNAQVAPNGDNLRADKQSKHGSTPAWPVEAGEATIYVQRDGRTLREADYDFGSDRYRSANINRWARHVAGARDAGGLIQLGHQASPEELIFAVRGDGQLVFRSYDPEQEVKGFARRVLAGGGKVLSAVAIPSEDGATDQIWALCDWGDARSVQVMADWFDDDTALADAFFVDDGLSDSLDVASSTISGLAHLAGVEVAVLADGMVHPPIVVPDSGTITIDPPACRRVVGRPYVARAKALRPVVADGSDAGGQGRIKFVRDIAFRLYRTGISILAAAGGAPAKLLHRPNSVAMDQATPLFTGDTEPKPLEGAYSRSGQYEIVSAEPLPAFVIAAMPRVELAER